MLQTGDEFTAKDAAQYFHRQEEGIARLDPALLIGRQTARGDYAVDMRMHLKILSPGVQDAEEADLGAEMFGIGGDFEQSRGAGAEQEIINNPFVVQSQPR